MAALHDVASVGPSLARVIEVNDVQVYTTPDLLEQIRKIKSINLKDHKIEEIKIQQEEFWGQLGICLSFVDQHDKKHTVRFRIGKERTLKNSDDTTPGGMDEVIVTRECPEARVYLMALDMLSQKGREKLTEVKNKHELTGWRKLLNELSLDKVIPFSDKFAVLRNGVGLLQALGTIMLILIAVGIVVAVIAKALPIITLVFAGMLIFQGFMFAVFQGYGGWYLDADKDYKVAQAIGADTKVIQAKRAMAVWTIMEGCLWIALGIFMIAFPHVAICGLTVTFLLQFILFNIFFTITFSSMVVLGGIDYNRHVTFREGLAEALGIQKQNMPRWWNAILPGMKVVLPYRKTKDMKWNEDQCLRALDYLIAQTNPADDELNVNGAARAHHRLEDQIKEQAQTVAKRARALRNKFDEEKNNAEALEEALEEACNLIRNVLKANEKKVLFDIITIRLGIIGFIVGGFLYNSLSIVHHSPLQHNVNINLEDVGGVCDFFAWMPLNHYFRDLDEPDRINALVGEDPVDEDPVDEDPVDEDPVDEDPVDEDPVDEDPVGEDPPLGIPVGA